MLDPEEGRNAGASAAPSVPEEGACRSNSILETAVLVDVFFKCTISLKSLPAFTAPGSVLNPVTMTRGTELLPEGAPPPLHCLKFLRCPAVQRVRSARP